MEKENYFLGSVGRVEAFRETPNGLELAFISKTLTDSGINTSITADDIRAGQGAPIVTRFYHDASVEITLTDVMFKRAYVEAQLGAKFNKDPGAEVFVTEGPRKPLSATTIQLERVPKKLAAGCVELSAAPVWYAKAGSNDWRMGSAEGLIATGVFDENSDYCIRYFAYDSLSYAADIMADIIPEELHLIITVPLYAGDSCSASTGKAAGEVQFDIPRFRLNGSQDFAAAMSSNQTMSLAGVAMASQKQCDTSAVLYTMRVKIEPVSSADVAKKYTMLEALDESLVMGAAPVVYGIDENMYATLLTNDLLSFKIGDADALVNGIWKTEESQYNAVITFKDVAKPLENVTVKPE